MTGIFLKILNMSISASWLILAVMVLRIVLKKAPKWANVLLWGIVAFRLLCPFSIESAMSLIPSAETVSPEIMMDPEPTIHTGVPVINDVVNPVISESFAPAPGASVNPLQVWIPVLAGIWVAGIVVLLGYTVVSYLLLCRKVGTAVLLKDNIYQSENVGSPFVLGIVRPKIYLPFQMAEQDLAHVIAHERAHIRRRDHWWKPFGFLLLTIYWFNPLMWLAYVLLCRDIELACDEKVIRELDNEQRSYYTQALLTCSVSRRIIAACPLAFGEVGIRERVMSVMNYKKPALRVVVLAVIVCAVVAVCFLTNPAAQHNEIEMVPTTANMQGTYDRYLYVPLEDGTYRYEQSDSDPRSVTLDELLYSFTEKAHPFDVEWSVYSVKEFPDCHVVCSVAGNTFISLYEYSPPKRVDPSTLEDAKKRGCVVMEDGEGTYGTEQWKKFYEATQNGKSASVKVVDYWTLDPDRCDETYYEVNKEDYPRLNVVDLAYDGKTFTLSWADESAPDQQYMYLMKYEDKIPYSPAIAQRAVTRYVLTNDDTVTWNKLFISMASSQLGAGIPHFSVYVEIAPRLSLDDVIALSQKGYDLSWPDFEKFDHITTGYGLYRWGFVIDDLFSLVVCGGTDAKPKYIYLQANDGTHSYLDIRDGGVTEFIDLHKDNPAVTE